MRIRCCFCGATLRPEDLNLNEYNQPAYCPICGQNQLNKDDRSGVSTRFLRPNLVCLTDFYSEDGLFERVGDRLYTPEEARRKSSFAMNYRFMTEEEYHDSVQKGLCR